MPGGDGGYMPCEIHVSDEFRETGASQPRDYVPFSDNTSHTAYRAFIFTE